MIKPNFHFTVCCLAFEWKWGWRWPCFERTLPAVFYDIDAVLALISRNVHKKSSVVSIKTRSPPASFLSKGQAAKHATVKESVWVVNSRWIQLWLSVLNIKLIPDKSSFSHSICLKQTICHSHIVVLCTSGHDIRIVIRSCSSSSPPRHHHHHHHHHHSDRHWIWRLMYNTAMLPTSLEVCFRPHSLTRLYCAFFPQLYYSTDFGFRWTLKEENVRSYFWWVLFSLFSFTTTVIPFQ